MIINLKKYIYSSYTKPEDFIMKGSKSNFIHKKDFKLKADNVWVNNILI